MMRKKQQGDCMKANAMMTEPNQFPTQIETVDELEEWLSKPAPGVSETLARREGDILILGVGGKMGPTLARMAKRASEAAGVPRKVIGVARFSEPGLREKLERHGVETIAADLLNRAVLDQLPDAPNVIFMAGRKFGSTGQEWLTWAMNVYLPGLVAERFRNARIVVFSTGNVYPLVPVESGGAQESDPPGPVGEYAQSCLGRERIFEHFSHQYGTPVLIARLNYAVETRYGILLDVAQKVWAGIPIPLAMGYVNVIWQGDANGWMLRCLDHCQCPPAVLNITGNQTLSIRLLAKAFGERFGREPVFAGEESPTALLSNASRAAGLFGPPQVTVEQVAEWVAHWIERGGPTYNKPTHYEARDGKF